MAIIFPGSPEVGDTYEAPNGIIYQYSDGAWRLSAENQGTIGVHMDTSPPANPQNGDLWFHTGEADLKIFYADPTSSQWIPASSPPDPYEENFVSTSGDTMTGHLTIVKEGFRLDKEDGDRHLTISQNGSDYYTNIWAHNCNPANNSRNKQGGIRIRSSETNGTSPYTTHWISEYVSTPHRVGSEDLNARTGIYFLQTPTKSHHAANKQYVDDAVKANSGTRTWKWATAGTPGPGEWTSYKEEYIRLHHTTHSGMNLKYSSGFNEDLNTGTTAIAKLAFTAWLIDGDKAQPKYFIWAGWFNDTSDYFEIKGLTSTDKTDLGLTSGSEYELHLSGFF